MQRLLQASSVNSYGSGRAEGMSDQFPLGLRVLVVDDDLTCLKILEQMLKKCMYTVTTCTRATIALSLLREKKGAFDVVISDVHMPDMDGYKLLEHVGLEMDLPVIMMSADGSTSAVMRGVKHGACDYLIKPVRLEELKNIWQHVIRKKCVEIKEHEQSGSIGDNERHKRVYDEAEYASSANEGTDANWKVHKKRRELKEEEDEGVQENEDPSASKKPRVVWSVELHQQFVNAVNQLGIEKAVPKRILELMNVPGLTRENVASHLQKFRLYLKRLSAQNQGSMCSSFGGHVEPSGKMSPITNASMQALAASGQIAPQTFAALHAEFLGRHPGSLVMPGVDQPTLLQEALHGPKGNPIESGAFTQPLMKSQTTLPRQFAQASISIDDSAGYLAWQEPLGTTVSSNNVGGLNSYGGNLLMQMHQQQQQQQSIALDSAHVLNVQPSCLVSPASSTGGFLVRNNSVPSSGNHNLSNTSFNGSSLLDYSLLSSPSHVSVGMGQMSVGDVNNVGLLRCYPVPSSVSSAPLSGSVVTGSNAGAQNWQVQNSVPMMSVNTAGQVSSFAPNPCEVSYGLKGGELLGQSASRSLGFANRGPSSLNRLVVEGGSMSAFTGDMSQSTIFLDDDDDDDLVKQEINLDCMDNVKVSMPVLHCFSPNDPMSVLSK